MANLLQKLVLNKDQIELIDTYKTLDSLGDITTAKELARLYGASNIGMGEFDYNTNIRNAYAANAIAYFCINLKAGLASQPIPELWLNSKKIKTMQTNNNLKGLQLLLNRPNEIMDWAAFVYQYMLYMDLAGESFIHRLPDSGGLKRGNGSMMLLNPSKVKIDHDHKLYEITVGDNKLIQIPFKNEDETRPILHRAFWHPISDRGLSPLTPAWKPTNNFNMGLEYNYSLLRNGARPGLIGILKKGDGKTSQNKATLTQEQLDDFTRNMSNFTGPEGAGKSLAMSGNWDLFEFSQSQKDLEWGMMLESMAKQIALSLQVDPIFLGFKGDSSYSNKREAYAGIMKFVILPSLNQFSSSFEHWMKEIWPGEWKLRFNTDDVAALDIVREQKVKNTIDLKNAGILTLDEAREKLNLPPLSDKNKEELNNDEPTPSDNPDNEETK